MNDSPAPVQRTIIKLARGVRDFWMIAGLALALFLAIDVVAAKGRLVSQLHQIHQPGQPIPH